MSQTQIRRWIACAAIGAVLALCGAGCGSDRSGDGGTSGGATATATTAKATVTPPDGLVKDGTLTLGTDFTYPPYESIDGSEQVGFDVELAAQLAATMGLQPDMRDTRFNSLIAGLQARRFDAIESALYITAERAKQVDYIPYFTTGNAFVVKQDGDYKPAATEDLCGHTVAVLQGSDVEDRTRREIQPSCAQELKLRSFPTDTAAFQEVAAGRADVLFTDRAVATTRVKDAPQLKMELSSDEVIFPVPVGLAVRKGDTALRTALEQALAQLRSSGELQRLLDRYGLKPVDPALVQSVLGGEQ